jgi:hypothetical protein
MSSHGGVPGKIEYGKLSEGCEIETFCEVGEGWSHPGVPGGKE